MITNDRAPPPPSATTDPGPGLRHCPDCGAAAGEERCPACGLTVGGPRAAYFWTLDDQAKHLSQLRDQALQQLRRAGDEGWPAPAVPPPPPPRMPVTPASGLPAAGAWRRKWTVRDLLLSLGVLSLIVAVVSFAVVSWDDLTTTGRVLLVVGVTAVVGSCAFALHRRGLTATAEAVTVVWAALLVADVAAGRVLLLPDAPPLNVWAAGMAGVAVALFGFTKICASRSAPPLSLAAAVVPLPLLALEQGSQILAAAAGVAGFAAAAGASDWLLQRSGKLGTSVSLGVQHATWSFASVAALLGLAWNTSLGVVVVLLITAFLVLSAVWASNEKPRFPARLWMAKAAGLVIAAPMVLTERSADGMWILLAAAVGAAAVLAVATRSAHTGQLGGVVLAGFVQLVIWVPMGFLALWSLGRLGEMAADPWTGSASQRLELTDFQDAGDRFTAVAILATLMISAWDVLREKREWWRIVGSSIALGALVIAVVVLGAPVWAAVVLFMSLGVAVLLATRNSELFGGDAAAMFLIGLGFTVSMASSTLTISALAAAAPIFWLFSYRSRPDSIGPLWLVAAAMASTSGLVWAITAERQWEGEFIGLSVLVAGAVLMLPLPVFSFFFTDLESGVLGYLRRRSIQLAHEISGFIIAAAALIAVLALGGSSVATAGLLIAAAVCVVQAVRPQRMWLAVAATAFVAAAVEVQLGASDIGLVEAFVAPVAVVAAVFGYFVYRQDNEVNSWIAWGPVTAIALGPSLVVALGMDPGPRPLWLPVVGLAVVALGLLRRLQAPVLLGSAVVAAIGIDFLITLAAELPRWIPFGAVGVLLIGIGAKFDQSRERAKNLVLEIGQLQ